MNAVIIPFPTRLGSRETTTPHPYDFWYALLEDMSPQQRRATIREAARYGVISERDAYIFATSWAEDGEAS